MYFETSHHKASAQTNNQTPPLVKILFGYLSSYIHSIALNN